MKDQTRRVHVAFLSIALFLLIWALAARIGNDPSVLPYPWRVAEVIGKEAANGKLFYHLAVTLARVAAAFTVAMAIGIALGVLLGRSSRANDWADPWVLIFLNLPALVVFALCFIWIGFNEVAVVVAVAINKIPMVTVMLREGTRALSPDLDDMARVYRMDRVAVWRHVVFPQLAPHIAAAARAGIALIWKIVLVAEFLGRYNGVGFQIHTNFQLFRVDYILAYSFSFVVVMLLIEFLVMQPMTTRAARWRRA